MRHHLAIAWFRSDQWDRLRALATDSHVLENTFEEWRAYAESQYADMKRKGLDVRKIDVDLDELVAWCNHKKIPLDANARSEFAAHKLQLESNRN